jgi:hypothetical protein
MFERVTFDYAGPAEPHWLVVEMAKASVSCVNGTTRQLSTERVPCSSRRCVKPAKAVFVVDRIRNAFR